MGLRQEGGAGGCLENLTNTLVGSCRALQVLVGANLLANLLTLDGVSNPLSCPTTVPTYLFGGDGLLGSLVQLFNGLGVVAEILLATDKDNGKTLAEVQNFGDPLNDTSVTIALSTS